MLRPDLNVLCCQRSAEDNGTVVAWGNNSYGQTNVPAGLSNVVEIVAGGYHSLALRRDGTAIAWGYNGSGALRIPVGVVNIVALGAGLDYSLAIMNDGTPFILRQSPDRTIYSGTTVSFSVAAVGASVLNYQWQFNGRDIDGATNAVLVVTNVALIGAGRYQCLVSNALGTGISSPIALTVLRSRPRIGASSSGLQLTSGGFSLQVDGLSSDGNIVLLFSTNLVDWQPVLTNRPPTGCLKMMDTVATNFPFGFYEVLEE